jgi:hypothetical protein
MYPNKKRLCKKTVAKRIRNSLHIPGVIRNPAIGFGGIAIQTIHVKPLISKYG